MELELIRFIKSNKNWEALIREKPYCIRIKRDNGYIMFLYSQIDSDFNNNIVRECRGIILDEKTLKLVCVPFFKFGNYGESYVSDIDWDSARVEEKIDGSLIKVWFDNNKWNVSTNGTINAQNANLGDELTCYKNFYDLFMVAVQNQNLNFDSLNRDCTYMFELTSPYNKVVVAHSEITITHIGTRNNKTLEEVSIDIGIKKPKLYSLKTLNECLEMIKILPFNDEGYVVVDKNYNRIKIKSLAYVVAHRLKNNCSVTVSRLIDMIKINETEEFTTYYPEYKKEIEKIKNDINTKKSEVENKIKEIKSKNFLTQKEFALYIKDFKFKSFLFKWQNNKDLSFEKWLLKNSSDKIKEYLYG